MFIIRARRHHLDKIPPLSRRRGYIFGNMFKGWNGVRYYITEPHRGMAAIKEAKTGKVVKRFAAGHVRRVVNAM